MSSRLLYISIHILIWGTAFYLMAPVIGQGLFNIGRFHDAQMLTFLIYGTLLNAILFYTYAHLALPPFGRNNSAIYLMAINAAYFVGFTGLELLIDHGYMTWVYDTVGGPSSPMDLRSLLTANAVITGGFMLAANLYGFSYGWFKGQQTRRELEQAKLEAELSALKHQIHPHFLFNILNGLYGLAFKNDDEPTAEGIGKLSGMMRYMLYESNDEKVPLEKEVEYIRNYIDLQRLRLLPTTQVDFSVRGSIHGKEIAPLLLIPFIENAFKHGVSTLQPTKIEIFLNLLDHELIFDVRNPLLHQGRGAKNTPGGIGLTNVKKRLDILYPKQHQLRIQNQEDHYHVHLTLSL